MSPIFSDFILMIANIPSTVTLFPANICHKRRMEEYETKVLLDEIEGGVLHITDKEMTNVASPVTVAGTMSP